jgi:excisionase family DNA binding protein
METAQLLDLTEPKVRRLLREKQLPGVRFGHTWRVDLIRLEELLATGAVNRQD